MPFSEREILNEIDLAFYGKPSSHFPPGKTGDVKYNFFLDLEHGYCETAGSKIHLYADSARWAVVFEKSGYQNRGNCAAVELDYIGNCIDYPVDKYPERDCITNSSRIILIEPTEFARIENKEGDEKETFEFIGQDTRQIKVRNRLIPFDKDYRNYEKFGIKVNRAENPRKLIGFADFVRYLNEINPAIVSAEEEEIREHIPVDIPKLMSITSFHFVSAYDESNPPSNQETYKLIAKILVTRDTASWKPVEEANNHWTNWESSNL